MQGSDVCFVAKSLKVDRARIAVVLITSAFTLDSANPQPDLATLVLGRPMSVWIDYSGCRDSTNRAVFSSYRSSIS